MWEVWIIVILVISLTALIIGPFIFIHIFNVRYYGHRAAHDYLFNPKEFSDLAYERKNFLSGKNILRGYKFYSKTNEKIKAVILLIVGIKNNHNEYLPEIAYFVSRGYCVFSFDPTGTGMSQGKNIKSLVQIVVDSHNAGKLISQDVTLNKYPLFVWGFSNGGYAALSLIGQTKQKKSIISGCKISAVAALSAFNSTYKMVQDYSKNVIGHNSIFLTPFLFIYNRIIFGKNNFSNVVKCIKNSDIPICLVHSRDDEVIPFENFEKIKKSIANPKSVFIKYNDRNHWVRFAPDVQKERERAEKRLVNASHEDKCKCMRNLAKITYNVDRELLNKVADFFDSVL